MDRMDLYMTLLAKPAMACSVSRYMSKIWPCFSSGIKFSKEALVQHPDDALPKAMRNYTLVYSSSLNLLLLFNNTVQN